MNENTGILWKCPVCGGALTHKTEEKRFLCDKGHSFDVARQGYVNLLLPNKRGTGVPGDSADMVRARTKFLCGGYYEGFSDGVNRLLGETAADCSSDGSFTVADAGCGEGYYTKRLLEHLLSRGLDAYAAGFDLSRDAVAHGAREARMATLSHRLSYGVASLFDMPLRGGSMSAVLNLFAPVAAEEFSRVLAPRGVLLMAVPAEEHLYGLKTAIYDRPYRNEVRRDVLPGFTLTRTARIAYHITVQGQEDIFALFMMTPYYWKTSKEDTEKLRTLDTLTTPVAFDLLLYRKDDEA